MVQVIFENNWEIILFGLFGLSYFFNMIYYGESSSSKVDAITKAFKGIVNEINALALMWKGENPPEPNVIDTKLDQIYQQISKTREYMENIDDRVKELEDYHIKQGHLSK